MHVSKNTAIPLSMVVLCARHSICNRDLVPSLADDIAFVTDDLLQRTSGSHTTACPAL